MFWALPNFLTVENAEHFPPLTTQQKFDVVTRSAFDYVEYGWYGFLSGISQAENGEPGYGQGFKGYAKRFGSEFGDGTIENYLVGAVLASAFHEDPRYFQSGKGGPWQRTGYTVSRIFVTRTDSGGRRFNFAEILGAAGAAAISNTYRPVTDRGVQNTLTTWWTQIGYDTLTIVVKEFWPDIRRKFSKDASPPSPGP